MGLKNEILKPWEMFCDKCNKIVSKNHKHCPKCDASPEFQEVRNYSMMWHDGDVHCTKCDAYVRGYDAG